MEKQAHGKPKKVHAAKHRGRQLPVWGFTCSKAGCHRLWSQCEHFEADDVQRGGRADAVVGVAAIVFGATVAAVAVCIPLYYVL